MPSPTRLSSTDTGTNCVPCPIIIWTHLLSSAGTHSFYQMRLMSYCHSKSRNINNCHWDTLHQICPMSHCSSNSSPVVGVFPILLYFFENIFGLGEIIYKPSPILYFVWKQYIENSLPHVNNVENIWYLVQFTSCKHVSVCKFGYSWMSLHNKRN